MVRTLFSSISTGSEIAQFRGEDPVAAERPLPAKLGYENVAQIVLCGSSVVNVREGGYAVGTYGHRDFALVRADQLIPMAKPEPTALLLVLASDTAKGILNLQLDVGSSILVMGAGSIGLLTLFNLHSRGHASIDVVEPIEPRRMFAANFGARSLFSPDDIARLAGISYTGGFECAGTADAFVALQNRMAHGGRICILSDARRSPLPLTPAFHRKELRVQGSSDGLNYQDYSKWFFENADRYPFPELFDYQVQFSELPSTLIAMSEGSIQPRKVLVTYNM